jgi:hypothetical protein
MECLSAITGIPIVLFVHGDLAAVRLASLAEIVRHIISS